jgi:hypothetical protein
MLEVFFGASMHLSRGRLCTTTFYRIKSIFRVAVSSPAVSLYT